MITFDRAGPLQNFNRSHVMVIGRSVSFSDPARPPGGGVGRPKHLKIPPLRKKKCMRFRTPGTFFFFKFSFKTPGRCFCEEKKISVTKNFHPPPHPHPHAPAQPSEHSPQSWCNNKYSQQFLCEIWTTTTTLGYHHLFRSRTLLIIDYLMQ